MKHEFGCAACDGEDPHYFDVVPVTENKAERILAAGAGISLDALHVRPGV